MILKRKVGNLDNDIVPTKTVTTDSSQSEEESSSCVTNKDNISQCSDDPHPKNEGNVGECFILSKLVPFKKLLQYCRHSCTME